MTGGEAEGVPDRRKMRRHLDHNMTAQNRPLDVGKTRKHM